MKQRAFTTVRLLKEMRVLGRGTQTLQRRLFAFLLLFLAMLMGGLCLILFSTGVFSTGLKESRMFLENELSHIAANLTKTTGTLAVEGVTLSEKLSGLAGALMHGQGIETEHMSGNAELLDAILQAAVDPMISSLEKNQCSGVFFVLDATVNPHAWGAQNSRAGIYLKNMEPNAVHKTAPTVRYLRGPSGIAREAGMAMLPQWRMEFSTEQGDFFHNTVSAAQNMGQDLSRLYYWNPAGTLSGDYEQAVLLCVPLLTQEGKVFGVCGFEISAMFFKLQNAPNNAVYNRVFAIWAPVEDGALRVANALYGGSYAVTPAGLDGDFQISPQSSGFYHYSALDGVVYTGLHQPMNLYPKDAVHAGQEWAVGVMMPMQELSAYMMENSWQIYLSLAVLLMLSVGMALMISMKYIAPVVVALNKVKEGSSEHEKTNIQEIDDLFAFLAERDAIRERAVQGATALSQADAAASHEEFVRNIQTLSPAERTVFNLYMEGYTAKEITKILCLSINTIKTHNRRIYQKLNVSSRKELLVHVSMMKERGGMADVLKQ